MTGCLVVLFVLDLYTAIRDGTVQVPSTSTCPFACHAKSSPTKKWSEDHFWQPKWSPWTGFSCQILVPL